MAAITICSDFGAQENSLPLLLLFLHLFAMKWWHWMPWTLFSECWALSQLFHSPLSLSFFFTFCHKGGVICISEALLHFFSLLLLLFTSVFKFNLFILLLSLSSELFISVILFSYKTFICFFISSISLLSISVSLLRLSTFRFKVWLQLLGWRRKWQPTLVFLLGESHGQRSLEGYSP